MAGMVALFAPCCITFLLPAYLGSVFKEKEKILFMTLVFGAGIFVMLLPAVLGVALVSKLLFRYHDTIYILGGLVMITVAAITFLGLKLPMPSLPQAKIAGRTDVLSIFILGIFSGITSACCAPVLVGVMALTFLSPTFFGALLVGSMYVLGMVLPLLVISVFLADKMPKMMFLRKAVFTLKVAGQSYAVIFSNLIASIIFLVTGAVTLNLALTGKLSASSMDQFTKVITGTLSQVNSLVGNNIFFNVIFVLLLIFFLYWVSKKR